MKRVQHSDALKAKVALEAIKNQKTANEIASDSGVHPGLVAKWKKQALQNMTLIFQDGRSSSLEAQEALKDKLYQQIGQLKVELDWLKKKTGITS
jgi:putative transposase